MDTAASVLNARDLNGDAVKALKRFSAWRSDDWFIARTGYTGEDGLEIALPESDATDFWQALVDAGVTPAGLGARDTLRLEAGMSLYGNDLDEDHTRLNRVLPGPLTLVMNRETLSGVKHSKITNSLVVAPSCWV